MWLADMGQNECRMKVEDQAEADGQKMLRIVGQRHQQDFTLSRFLQGKQRCRSWVESQT